MKVNKYLSPLVVLALYSAVVCDSSDSTININNIDIPNDSNDISKIDSNDISKIDSNDISKIDSNDINKIDSNDISKIDSNNDLPNEKINNEYEGENNECKCCDKKNCDNSKSEKECSSNDEENETLTDNNDETEQNEDAENNDIYDTEDGVINILSPNYTNDFYNAVIASLNENDKNGNYKNKYEDFKNKYDNVIAINEKEFEIFSKLVEVFMKNHHDFNLNSNFLYELLTKALSDQNFKTEFKEFMNNMYNFVKKNQEGKVMTDNDKMYMALFENVLSLLNSM
ncbi:MSP7-like protein [Plasmodium berghei]|uniref:Parasitophorous vacuolar protein 4 n=2 Tax=Plasmodium berghei TaxID=5821 RepID=A0A509AQL6_PLABA|nr:MSP7-like protein [Plasmodium berghei ANKA]CXJ01339.1 MSP7-like protein [Plasmodium berghei]SCL98162.1 MSP7-like protein [Plasmodium berghei]SCM16765.1 MSP7-like protein [Plasmodium berghei]SCM18563.1 MSP7-like protein [Plasmodium berghei]SCN27996.1 MSP7-like protein [Plasmodium berghei]|eukprot:XP_034423649.1 MSP7-like protein [Plasmodium berghei ANKA]